jgi:uncharacterized repeat protein (TIGR03803 family)
MSSTRAAAQQEKVLHSFNYDSGADGALPVASLTFDRAGNLYGTTSLGGSQNDGAVFELSPKTGADWTETVLHNFDGGSGDGIYPHASLIFDGSGNLYGTTGNGGCNDASFGIVFEITPAGSGDWAESVPFNFCLSDESGPLGNLVFDSAGNLFGTTSTGGTGRCSTNPPFGCGTIFELTPKAGGGWTNKVLHNFDDNGKDGYFPQAGLVLDAAGNLYGTTPAGGTGPCYQRTTQVGCGTVFELSPQADGTWKEKILHNFSGGEGAQSPQAGLIFDASGNLYGTTTQGGGSANCYSGCGTVFELTPTGSGTWTEKVLHVFGVHKFGQMPLAGLVFDGAGNLYGTTYYGGAGDCTSNADTGCGTVFELSPQAGGNWTEKVLHNFNNNGSDGIYPRAGLILDASGNLYGTTGYGGTGACGTVAPTGCGTVFEIKR